KQQDPNRVSEELITVVQEMKNYFWSERRCQSKLSILDALNCALPCVHIEQGKRPGERIQPCLDSTAHKPQPGQRYCCHQCIFLCFLANSELFQILSENGAPQADVSRFSLEELASIASEHTSKNSFQYPQLQVVTTGFYRTVRTSEQPPAVLNCKGAFLESCRFVELLAPQDVKVFDTHGFLSGTTEPKEVNFSSSVTVRVRSSEILFLQNPALLRGGPSERIASGLMVSVLCSGAEARVRGQPSRPFRIFPFDSRAQPHLPRGRALLSGLVEETHSGYEGESGAAVPLLGHLPQDLIGTSVLTYLHPEDQSLMVARHQKVRRPPSLRTLPREFLFSERRLPHTGFQLVQPREPLGPGGLRHHRQREFRTNPLKEDVFATRIKKMNRNDKDVTELQEQIQKLLLQLTLQQVCASVNKIKNLSQQLYIESRTKSPDRHVTETLTGQPGDEQKAFSSFQILKNNSIYTESCGDLRKDQPSPACQQINCTDSILRYETRVAEELQLSSFEKEVCIPFRQLPRPPKKAARAAKQLYLRQKCQLTDGLQTLKPPDLEHGGPEPGHEPGLHHSHPTAKVSVLEATVGIRTIILLPANCPQCHLTGRLHLGLVLRQQLVA
ncbi:Period circadian protein-like protein 3, partial [Camelus dromedarius]